MTDFQIQDTRCACMARVINMQLLGPALAMFKHQHNDSYCSDGVAAQL